MRQIIRHFGNCYCISEFNDTDWDFMRDCLKISKLYLKLVKLFNNIEWWRKKKISFVSAFDGKYLSIKDKVCKIIYGNFTATQYLHQFFYLIFCFYRRTTTNQTTINSTNRYLQILPIFLDKVMINSTPD